MDRESTCQEIFYGNARAASTYVQKYTIQSSELLLRSIQYGSMVLNVTKFLEEHPGGAEVLIDSAGKDATKDFDIIGHSKAAKSMLLKYQVGVVEGFIFQDVGNAEEFIHEGTPGKEMTAFVIKNDMVTKYSKILEFFVPLMVVCFYFGYRCLARVAENNY
ncbi:Cytochrome b5 [Thalictrum thalictroides]|uniref:Cytochrome b5 n=1 Tax=Thalictrum thalictroides TaxID=46969 RepID=A0A7J6VF98_THATH|nr:Cytochrome b5 [Thalictrum thalictroides]